MRLFCLILILIASVSFPVDYQKEINAKRKELDKIYSQLNKQKAYLDKTEKQANDVQEGIRTIDIILKRQNLNIKKITDQISKGQKDINSLNSEIQSERVKFDKTLTALTAKYNTYYHISNSDFLETIFESDKFSDQINNLYFFESIISADVNFLKDIRHRNNRLIFKEKRLNTQLIVLKDKQQVIGGLKQKILQNKKKKKRLYNNLMSQKKEYRRKLRTLEKNSMEIEQLVIKLQKQSKNFKQIGSGNFIWPVLGRITSRYGYRIHPIFKVRSFHSGLDIGAPKGRPIFAVDDGIVMFSGKWGGYGKTVIIDHGNKRTTLYAHMSKYYVKRTLKVKKGQVIGLVGATGLVTGPHLHFEVRVNGKVRNPINYLPKQ